jgi:hypothetical protein
VFHVVLICGGVVNDVGTETAATQVLSIFFVNLFSSSMSSDSHIISSSVCFNSFMYLNVISPIVHLLRFTDTIISFPFLFTENCSWLCTITNELVSNHFLNANHSVFGIFITTDSPSSLDARAILSLQEIPIARPYSFFPTMVASRSISFGPLPSVGTIIYKSFSGCL